MDGSRARALLGVPEHATTQQISRAFRGAAFVAHPDRGGDGATFRELIRARDVLLASTPRSAVENPYASAVTAAARSSFSVVDSPHPRFPVVDLPADGRNHHAERDFAAVLASVLAAA